MQFRCRAAEVRVIVPTPWVPPFIPVELMARFRRIPPQERRAGIKIYYPRVPGLIEYHTHRFDARLALSPVLALARSIYREWPFDVIHAHFIYPDGVVASQIGRELGVPVMTSEHAFWLPWLVDQPNVGAQVAAALPGIKLVTAVSDFLRKSIDAYTRGRVATAVLPNAVDDEVFSPAPRLRDLDELLYVGLTPAELNASTCCCAPLRKPAASCPSCICGFCRAMPLGPMPKIVARCDSSFLRSGSKRAVQIETGRGSPGRRRGNAALWLRRCLVHDDAKRSARLRRSRWHAARHSSSLDAAAPRSS